MPKRCSVCTHKDLLRINSDLFGGKVTIRDIADRYGLARSSVQYHKNLHLCLSENTLHDVQKSITSYVAVKADTTIQEAEEGRSMPNTCGALHDARLSAVDRIEELISKTNDLICRAEDSGRDQNALWAIAEARKNIEALVRVYEVQERIKALETSKVDNIRASAVYAWLHERYPAILDIMMYELSYRSRMRGNAGVRIEQDASAREDRPGGGGAPEAAASAGGDGPFDSTGISNESGQEEDEEDEYGFRKVVLPTGDELRALGRERRREARMLKKENGLARKEDGGA